MRTVGVVTVARSDYGIYLPLLRMIKDDPDLHLHLLVSGMHLSPEFGRTVRTIEEDGFEIGERVEMLVSSDSPEGIAKSIGLGTIGFAQAYARFRPDILCVLGDRFEMYVAALAALPFTIPVAHIHGGELTEGAIDDALRHSLSKLSHLHFASTEVYARRIMQLGEQPWRITVSGAPALDNLRTVSLFSRVEMEARYGISLEKPPLLVTFHPVTLEYEQARAHTGHLLEALAQIEMPMVFTMANSDTGGRVIQTMIKEFVKERCCAYAVDNLGIQGYFSLMNEAAAMVGNSSSGIIEAPSFHLPVVNIGNRQAGRVKGPNVIDVVCEEAAILEGIRKALKPEFKQSLHGVPNPYGCGNASEKIIARLKTEPLDKRLLIKRFYDLDQTEPWPVK